MPMCVEPSNEHWSFSLAVNTKASQVAVESATRLPWPTANDSMADANRSALGPETRGVVLN
jgi:hypothetical protein